MRLLINSSLILCFVVSLLVFFSNCFSENPDPDACRLLEPSAVNSKIIPVPTSIKINEQFNKEPGIIYTPAIVGMQGQRTLFDFLNIGGQYDKVLFGVRGAASYHEFEIDTLKDDDSFFLFVDVESSISVGCFDIFTQLISNDREGSVRQFTLDIRARGGNNTSGFAGKTWRQLYTENPAENSRTYVDTLYTEMQPTSGLCTNDIMTEFSYQIKEYLLDLKSNADFSLVQEDFSRSLDFSSSTCDNLVYEESTVKSRFDGSWGYDATNDILTIVYLYGQEEPYFPGTEYRIYKVDFEGSLLVLSLIEYESSRIPEFERTYEYFQEM